MNRVALLPDRDRKDLFVAAAAKKGLHPAVIEKDFWVCWMLQRIFSSPELGNNLVFKGGTSLSKVYHLIERFSEDIDLVLNWNLLGYGATGRDPWEKQLSNTKRERLNREVNDGAARYLADTFCPHLTELVASTRDLEAVLSTQEELVINIRYPAAFHLSALRPEVKLEIGPLASWLPSQPSIIRPYAADHFPDLFDNPDCSLVAILAERTFWEKATILHQQAHRTTTMPPHYSRHYYDLYCMASSPIRQTAMREIRLMSDVVEFKQIFYRCPWARYEEAKPGTFRLLPSDQGEKELAADYKNMQPMFFRNPPAWETIITGLRDLEQEINSLNAGKDSP